MSVADRSGRNSTGLPLHLRFGVSGQSAGLRLTFYSCLQGGRHPGGVVPLMTSAGNRLLLPLQRPPLCLEGRVGSLNNGGRQKQLL
eukprot:scaffold181254_cov40-Prasinocladus_malaysianus.AAC.2